MNIRETIQNILPPAIPGEYTNLVENVTTLLERREQTIREALIEVATERGFSYDEAASVINRCFQTEQSLPMGMQTTASQYASSGPVAHSMNTSVEDRLRQQGTQLENIVRELDALKQAARRMGVSI